MEVAAFPFEDLSEGRIGFISHFPFRPASVLKNFIRSSGTYSSHPISFALKAPGYCRVPRRGEICKRFIRLDLPKAHGLHSCGPLPGLAACGWLGIDPGDHNLYSPWELNFCSG